MRVLRRSPIVGVVVLGVVLAAGPTQAQTPAPSTTTTTDGSQTDGGQEESDGSPGLAPGEAPALDPTEVSGARTTGQAAADEILRRLAELQAQRVARARAEVDAADSQVGLLTDTYIAEAGSIRSRGQHLDDLQYTKSEAVRAFRDARVGLSASVSALYVRGARPITSSNLDVDSPLDHQSSKVMMYAAVTAARDEVDKLEGIATSASAPDLERIAGELGEARGELEDLLEVRATAKRLLADADAALTDVEALPHEWVFPVAGPVSFGDSFLAPRFVGGVFHHRHQGADIFAAHGTPVVAVERGTLFGVGTGSLGGIKLWLLGETGTAYYYAHLSGYAPDVANDVFVEAGETLGHVGDTGNARGTDPHLHFEIHPDAGPAINPTALLRHGAENGP